MEDDTPTNSATLSQQVLSWMVYNIFLPSYLPTEGQRTAAVESEVLTSLMAIVHDFSASPITSTERDAVTRVLDLLRSIHEIHDYTDLDRVCIVKEQELRAAIMKLSKGDGGSIVIHIAAQNAAIMLTCADQDIVIDSFELSPPNADVYRNNGRLFRSFPNESCRVKISHFIEESFLSTFTSTVAKLARQSVGAMQPRITKASQSLVEDRDTPHPFLVTRWLAGFVQGMSSTAHAQGKIEKHTREEVMWNNSRFPWRRSPVWLLFRVSMQLTLSHCMYSEELALLLYKRLMIAIMVGVYSQAYETSWDSTWLHGMHQKIAGRLAKLQGMLPPTEVAKIDSLLLPKLQVLHSNGNHQQHVDRYNFDLSDLGATFDNDTMRIQDSGLENKITTSRARQSHSNASPSQRLAGVRALNPEALPSLDDFYDAEGGFLAGHMQSIALGMVEAWLDNHLVDWAAVELHGPDSCVVLVQFLGRYNAIASRLYQGDPQSQSRKVLNCVRLFIELDKAAVVLHPVLRQYTTGIFSAQLQHLLTVTVEQEHRLHAAEEHLLTREQDTLPYDAVLDRTMDENSFSVKLFNASDKHKGLLRHIQEQDALRRQAKLDELEASKQQLIADRQRLDSPEHRRMHDRPRAGCQTCFDLEQLELITIDRFEVSLPSLSLDAQKVVYGLQMETIPAAWREATQIMKNDVFKDTYGYQIPVREAFHLKDDPFLAQYFVEPPLYQRLGLASTTKATTLSHRRAVRVAQSVQRDLIAENGFLYRVIDRVSWTQPIATYCSSYVQDVCGHAVATKRLQPVVLPEVITRHPDHNALQAHTMPDLPGIMQHELLHLYAHLQAYDTRLVRMVQSIKGQGFDLNNEEVVLVFMQCLYGGGHPMEPRRRPGNTPLRVPGAQLSQYQLAWEFVSVLQEHLSRIESNKEAFNAMAFLIGAATRITDCCNDTRVGTACEILLSRARKITFGWLVELLESVPASSSRLGQSVRTALLVLMTFDVQRNLQALVHKNDNIALILSCMILLFQERSSLRTHDEITNILYNRYTRLLWRLLPILVPTEQSAQFWDQAVGHFFHGFPVPGTWVDLARHERESSTVHHYTTARLGITVDLSPLTGELFVNNKPLGRLPTWFSAHRLYQRVLGNSSFDVISDTTSGLDFQSLHLHKGWRLQFGRTPRQEFILRRVTDTSSFELLDPSIMIGLYPNPFINNFVHWLDVADGTIHFCALDDAFGTTKWVLSASSPRGRSLQNGDGDIVAPMMSPFRDTFVKIFSRITRPGCVVVTRPLHGSITGVVVRIVDVPRMRFSIRVTAADKIQIMSLDFPGQHISTKPLLSLLSYPQKLLLEDDDGAEWLVLVEDSPNGLPPPPIRRMHLYTVDRSLGRLQPVEPDVRAILYLAFTHARSSYHQADLLTGCTGTEMALRWLDSARIRALQDISPDDQKLLASIALFTPLR
ncbi:hypothetical protein AMS68_003218 [Peltaster fructicola]|uniref:DUF6606 domain-containing protein n=1 Tax=Peltaster fructicola TaxID=286661 RepID=A0A6H0XSR4_9PEZI|nr:hypothetical protein AMS68_003218 [Peltaster fructicola]